MHTVRPIISACVLAAALLAPTLGLAQHQGLFERGPRAPIIGEHGTYSIVWLTINDQILLRKPKYEIAVNYRTPRRGGAAAVFEKHWVEMLEVAQAEILRRCPPPAQVEYLRSTRDYIPNRRAAGATLRVDYRCL